MDRVTKFAKANLKNKKDFGEDARLAFKRHINDLARSEKNDPIFPYRNNKKKATNLCKKTRHKKQNSSRKLQISI